MPLDYDPVLIVVKLSCHETTCDIVRFIVEGVNGDSATDIAAFVVPNICSALGSQEIDRAKECFAHLSDIDLADSHHGDTPMDIDLLIEADHMWQFLTGEKKWGESGRGPMAFKTILGWALSGPVPTESKPLLANANFVSIHVLRVGAEIPKAQTTDELLRGLWDLESIGIRDRETVHESFLKNVSVVNGRLVCFCLPKSPMSFFLTITN